MKYVIIAIVAIIGIAGAVAYRAFAPLQQTEIKSSVVSVQNDTRIYDVRSAEEYSASHVKGAVLFPVTDIQKGILPDLPKDARIALYCRSGNRSKQAADLLRQAGYSSVQDLGGLSDLAKYGLKAE